MSIIKFYANEEGRG